VKRSFVNSALVVCVLAAAVPVHVLGQTRGAAPARARGAQAATANTTAATGEAAIPPGYVIGPMDVLEVLFWKDKDLSAEVIVRPDGKITLPLINELQAGGVTPEQLRTAILEQAQRYVEDPSVVVRVKEIKSRQVYILGEVAKPGTYPLGGPTSVLQLIATAGGFNEFASTGDIVVIRGAADGPNRIRFNYKDVVKGDLTQNIELKSGDTVVVP
jgi:polysaccharide export outer membrane protein